MVFMRVLKKIYSKSYYLLFNANIVTLGPAVKETCHLEVISKDRDFFIEKKHFND